MPAFTRAWVRTARSTDAPVAADVPVAEAALLLLVLVLVVLVLVLPPRLTVLFAVLRGGWMKP